MAGLVEVAAKEERELSPWADRQANSKKRVVGWRDGQGVTDTDVADFLRKERNARHDYKAVRKAVARVKKTEKEVPDPLSGLPSSWQAFWSTVPHLDPKTAFKEHLREQAKVDANPDDEAQADGFGGGLVKERKRKADLLTASDKARAAEIAAMDVDALSVEVRERKHVLEEKQRLLKEWDAKLARVRDLDKLEERQAQGTLRRVERATFQHGMARGKLSSSELYFTYQLDDQTSNHNKEKASLRKTNGLMLAELSRLTAEVRDLLRAQKVPDTEPSSEPAAE